MADHTHGWCLVCKRFTGHIQGMCREHQPLQIQEYQALTWGSRVPMPDPDELKKERKRSVQTEMCHE